uniref:ENTH domain-containing protein n=1 Tax=Heterorhabditis bacteriophora TaxID=37862 RepID=A0A1I7XQV3_HETBA
MREEVLLRKLLADGEGTGEERRFQIVIQLLRNLRNPNTANRADGIKILKNVRHFQYWKLNCGRLILCFYRFEFADEDDTIDSESLDTADKKDEDKEERSDVEVTEKGKISKESSDPAWFLWEHVVAYGCD